MGFLQQLLTLSFFYVLIGVFEACYPVEKNQPLAERGRNVLLTLLFLFTGGLFALVAFSLIHWPPQTWQVHGFFLSALMILFALFVTDFLYYWFHRSQHTFNWFWVIHEVHHSDAHMNGTTDLRTFWLENPLQLVFVTLPAAYLSHLDANATIVLGLILLGFGVFNHANWRLQFGPFTPVLSGPQLHRIHHSRLPQHYDKNFAQFFPALDMLFGTYLPPARDEFPPTGVSRLRSTVSFNQAVIKPLRSCWQLFGTTRIQ